MFVGPECMEKHLELEKPSETGFFKWKGIEVLAVPAYNIINKDLTGIPFIPKDTGTATFLLGDFRVCVAGDTELILK